MTSPRACSVTPIWTVGTAYGSCRGDHIIRYDTRTGIAQRLVSRLRGDITAISETDGTNLFIGTVNGLFRYGKGTVSLRRLRTRTASGRRSANSTTTPVRRNCSWEPSEGHTCMECPQAVRCGMWYVNRITPLNDRELLIATGGRGYTGWIWTR